MSMMFSFDKDDSKVAELLEQLWGKTDPYESLFSHSDKTAQAMEVLSEYVPGKFDAVAAHLGIEHQEAVRLASYLAGVHDIGKAVPVWQGQRSAPEQQMLFYKTNSELLLPDEFSLYFGYRHERGGFLILNRIWKEEGVFNDAKVRKNLAAVVLTHHQKTGHDFPSDPAATTRAKCGAGCPFGWVECQKIIESHYRKKYAVDRIRIKGGDMDVPCMVMSGLLIISDWMASSLGQEPYESETERNAFHGKLQTYLSEMGIQCVSTIPYDFQEMWPWIKEMRPLQRKMSEIAANDLPMLTIIEESMGAGKTEASLYLANRIQRALNKGGLYIALPTSATANQMHQRVDELLERFHMKGARLLHGTAWLSTAIDNDELSDAEKFLAPVRMGLFAPYGVGTIDQILMAVLKMKYGNLRMTGIADKVLIVDEVHAYDAYMSEELQILLKWCKQLSVPVIMLSATLPKEKRAEYIGIYSREMIGDSGYPRVTTVLSDGSLKQNQISGKTKKKTYSITTEAILHDEDAIVDLAITTVRNGGTLCLNVNTVSRAVDLTKRLDAKAGDIEIHLFHSRFSLARRQEIEEECIRLFGKDTSHRPQKAILVATQVVEQSLDIDFDYYITDICPIDLLLQRLGRQFRHEETKRPCSEPKSVVLVPDEDEDYGAAKRIYMEYLLDKTKELLETLPRVTVPDNIQELVDNVYCGDPELEGNRKAYQEMIMKDEVSRGVTDITALRPPQKYFQFGRLLQRGDLFDAESSSRLAEPSVRAAILPNDLYQKAIEGSLSRSEQITAFSYSFSIAEGMYDFRDAPQGERMLQGVFLMPGGKCDFSPTEMAQFDRIRVDPRYGIVISKG